MKILFMESESSVDSKDPYTRHIKVQKRSKDTVQIIHVTSGVQL